MSGKQRSFTYWQHLLTDGGPDDLADRILNSANDLGSDEVLPPITAVIARDTLLENIGNALEAESSLMHVPYVLQDVFDVEGCPTFCGAPFNDPFEIEADYSGLLLQKLNQTGALYAGKVHPSDFALGLNGEGSRIGRLPTAGSDEFSIAGSAAGCAYAVSHGVFPLAFALDTLGGARLSAATAGVYSFRLAPSNEAVDGVFQSVPSLESLAWMTQGADDLLKVYRALCLSEEDKWAADEDFNAESVKSVRPIRALFVDGLGGPTERCLKNAALKKIHPLEIHDHPSAVAHFSTIALQARAALQVIASRELFHLHQYWFAEYRKLYPTEIAHMLKRGETWTAERIDRAADIRRLIRVTFLNYFKNYDCIVLPVTPIGSPRREDFYPEFNSHIETLLAPLSLASLPALTIPISLPDGRWGGLQIILNPDDPLLPIRLLKALDEKHEEGDESVRTRPSSQSTASTAAHPNRTLSTSAEGNVSANEPPASGAENL